MTISRLNITLISAWLLIALAVGVDPPEFPNYPENDPNQCPTINQNDANAVFNTFVANLVQAFGEQADNDGRQFAVLILVPPQVTDILTMPFEPHGEDGWPIVDNTHPVSPAAVSDRVNYVVSRPNYDDDAREIVHAEILVLNELEPLIHSFRCRYGQDPAAIILYTWIFPCENCYVPIAHRLNPFNLIPRVLLYSTLGMRGMDDVQRAAQQRQNEFIYHFLRGYGIYSRHVRCLYHPNRGLIKRSIDNEPTCEPLKTVQTYLFNLLIGYDQFSCGSPENQRTQVVAELVNRLMQACGKENFKAGCGKRYILREGVVQGACEQFHYNHNIDYFLVQIVGGYVDIFLKHGDAVISKPLLIENQHAFPGILSTTSQLAYTETPIPCKDIRREGLFCSHWKSAYLTAGNGVCKATSMCGYHQGTNYRWCYLYIGGWNYCCDEGAPCVNGKCKSGSKQVWCFGDSIMKWRTKSNRGCMSITPCGYHNGNWFTKWCWIDNTGNTEDC